MAFRSSALFALLATSVTCVGIGSTPSRRAIGAGQRSLRAHIPVPSRNAGNRGPGSIGKTKIIGGHGRLEMPGKSQAGVDEWASWTQAWLAGSDYNATTDQTEAHGCANDLRRSAASPGQSRRNRPGFGAQNQYSFDIAKMSRYSFEFANKATIAEQETEESVPAMKEEIATAILRATARSAAAHRSNGTASSRGVLLVSGSTAERDWTENVTRNQMLFANLHGDLDYAFVGPDAARGLLSSSKDYQPQWLKIQILRHLIHSDDSWRSKHPYILWIDDDIVVTSPRNFVEEMVGRMGPEDEMLIAKDAGDPKGGVNTGMMLLRASDGAMDLLDSIWSMTSEPAPGGTLGTCRKQKCLHEQAAINILRDRDSKIRAAIRVVDPVEDAFNINTFYRRSHRDFARGMRINYKNDPEQFKWAPNRGLNTCHVTGMEKKLRLNMIGACLETAQTAFMQDAEGTLSAQTAMVFI